MEPEFLWDFLGTIGLGSPLARASVGAALGAIPIFLHLPLSYTEVEEGFYIPRKWSLLSSDPTATAFPWFIFPILGAFFFGLVL